MSKEIDLGKIDEKYDTIFIPIKTWEDISKKLKVSEVIWKKNVAITLIKKTQSVIEYNGFAYDFLQIKRVDEEEYKLSPQPLTEEEYDLLKYDIH